MAQVSEATRFICLFHDPDRARAAVNALQKTGIAGENIVSLTDTDRASQGNGAESLTSIGVPERDLRHLEDGLRRGGVVISLQAPESRSEAIEAIFHRYSADKIDEAEPSADPTLSGLEDAAPGVAGAPTSAGTYDGGEATMGSAVIPIAEEELQVGKRAVDRGGVRVYRRTVEEPVQQDVDLHNERVVLEYREVDRPVTDADLRAGNQQIELIETAEVPVVEKVARVVEEVRVGKVESDRTEVVNETVRRTEVDVQPVDAEESRSSRR